MNILEEINQYQPKENPMATEAIMQVRQLRKNRKITDEEYCKFWSKNEEFLEEKWQAELYNKECFIRMINLLPICKTKPEEMALISKINMFKNKLLQVYEEMFEALKFDINKYAVNLKQQVDWND